jgi:hypothetical protein
MLHTRRTLGAVDLFMVVLLALVAVALVMVGMMANNGVFESVDGSDGVTRVRMGNAPAEPRPLTEAELTEAQQKLLADKRADLDARELALEEQRVKVAEREADALRMLTEYRAKIADLDADDMDSTELPDEVRTVPTPR